MLEAALLKFSGIQFVQKSESGFLIECAEEIKPDSINKFCFEQGVVLSQLNVKRKSLEKRFLEITGNQSDR